MDRLQAEITVDNWELARDEAIRKAMRNVEGWQARRLEVEEYFNTYTAWFKTHHASLMDDHGSSYWKMKKNFDEFLDKFHGVMSELDREDERRSLFTL